MPVLQLNDQQFPLTAGPTRVGAGAGVDLALPADAALGVQAVIERAGGESLVIRRATAEAQIRVNGVLLGAEPTPLMHGDKVEIGGLELRYADDAKGGATQFVSASALAALAGARRAGSARATAGSGGRLVSLVDGKEYLVPDAGVVIGRDASCDVVVGLNEVSRRHAEIVPGEQGYMIRDTSANGVFVNGERVQGSQLLARADVLRVGSEEFRFYADIAAAAAHAAPAVASAAPVPAVPAPASPAPAHRAPVSAEPPTAPIPRATMPTPAAAMEADFDLVPETAIPVAPRAAPPAVPPRVSASAAHAPLDPPTPLATAAADDPRPVLATLETLNEGPMKGSRHALRTPLAHVGRGAHNDVRLADESVSETHAKLQRREDGWYLVDMDSTNGSYVGGSRVDGERRIDGSPDLRFGGVKMRFVAIGASAAGEPDGKGTRAIAAVERPRLSVAPAMPAQPVPARSGSSAWLWILAAVVIAAAAFFVLKGRA